MQVTRRVVILLLAAAALPAVAQTFSIVPRPVCIASGSMTYRMVSETTHPDYVVKIDPAAPDLRVALVDAPDVADFLLVDDGPATPCPTAGDYNVRTIAVSANARAADLTVAVSAPETAQHRIFLRSDRISAEAAAGLFAVMQAEQRALAGR